MNGKQLITLAGTPVLPEESEVSAELLGPADTKLNLLLVDVLQPRVADRLNVIYQFFVNI